MIAVPTCAAELAYRLELRGVPRPVPPPQGLPKAVAEALSLDWTDSPVPRLQPMWPWRIAGFLALGFVNDTLLAPFPGARRALLDAIPHRATTIPTAPVAYAALVAAGIRPDFFRRFAMEVWISRNWTADQALAARADSLGVAERARTLYGKELAALDTGEVAGLVTFLRSPSAMRRSPDAWLSARSGLLRRMGDAGLITEATRAAADRSPLVAPGTR